MQLKAAKSGLENKFVLLSFYYQTNPYKNQSNLQEYNQIVNCQTAIKCPFRRNYQTDK